MIDQQLPPVLAEQLSDAGDEAIHVRDLGLSRASDAQIWDLACSRNAVLVTKDVDFIRIQAAGGSAGLVWIRIGNCTNDELLSRIKQSWPGILRRLNVGERMVELR